METLAIGLDVGKNWLHAVAVDRAGRVQWRRKFARAEIGPFFANLPPALVGMESCGGANHWGRLLQRQGHEARLIAAQFVKPYRKSQKNDFNDAEAIAEAVTRQHMRFVPIAAVEQSDLQAVHRVREQLQAEMIRLGNQIRAFLRENGLVVSVGPDHLQRALPQLIADTGNALSARMRMLLQRLLLRLQSALDEREQIDLLLKEEARTSDACQRLMTVPGIGVVGATAIVAAVGNGGRFNKARDLAAWIGLTPKQNSTGGKTNLGGISKRGNAYLRKVLVHGARSVLLQSHRHQDRMRRWAGGLSARKHHNVAACAVANKVARIAWAVLRSGRPFDPGYRARPI
jgi:transposase